MLHRNIKGACRHLDYLYLRPLLIHYNIYIYTQTKKDREDIDR